MDAPLQQTYQPPQQPVPPRPSRLKVVLAVVIGLFVVAFIALYFIGRSANREAAQPSVIEEVDPGARNHEDAFPGDRDRDGIDDAQEEALGTSDRDFDTDGDGLSDDAEINGWGTDPTNRDTDGDGFADGFEVIKGFNPLGEGTYDEAEYEAPIPDTLEQ